MISSRASNDNVFLDLDYAYFARLFYFYFSSRLIGIVYSTFSSNQEEENNHLNAKGILGNYIPIEFPFAIRLKINKI